MYFNEPSQYPSHALSIALSVSCPVVETDARMFYLLPFAATQVVSKLSGHALKSRIPVFQVWSASSSVPPEIYAGLRFQQEHARFPTDRYKNNEK